MAQLRFHGICRNAKLSILSLYLHFYVSIVILSINSRFIDLDIESGVFIGGGGGLYIWGLCPVAITYGLKITAE